MNYLKNILKKICYKKLGMSIRIINGRVTCEGEIMIGSVPHICINGKFVKVESNTPDKPKVQKIDLDKIQRKQEIMQRDRERMQRDRERMQRDREIMQCDRERMQQDRERMQQDRERMQQERMQRERDRMVEMTLGETIKLNEPSKREKEIIIDNPSGYMDEIPDKHISQLTGAERSAILRNAESFCGMCRGTITIGEMNLPIIDEPGRYQDLSIYSAKYDKSISIRCVKFC